jgi:hypothetical protein
MRSAWLLSALLVQIVSQHAAAQGSDPVDTARLIAQRALIVDTHIDAPYRLHEAWADVSGATAGGEFDYERARLGYAPKQIEAILGGDLMRVWRQVEAAAAGH